MAWISDKWYERKEREEIRRSIDDLISAMLAQPSLTTQEDVELDGYLKELERLERIKRGETDLLYFAWEYFSEIGNPGNPGNWDGFDIATAEDAPAFHVEICSIINDVSNVHINDKAAVAAPRSHAKSSYLSKAFPLHEIVYRKRKYTIIISETPQVSTANMEWLSLQLKHNKKLREDFGPLLSPKQQENPKDNSQEFIAWESRDNETKFMLAKVEAASTGQALRGRNWNGVRPDLIICDDLEDIKSNAATEDLRKKMRDWFSQTVIPLGDPKGKRTALVYMGTTVHHDALLIHVLYKRSDFKTKVYRAIIVPPERGDLWEECRLIYTDRENPNRAADAQAFYDTHKEEMGRGAVVLWPEVQPLFKLMKWKWDNGSKAFNTEYMNNPLDEESMIFNPEKFTYWDEIDKSRTFPHKEYGIFMGVDFAMGKQRGDFSAIVTVAKHRENGAVYVIDAWGERVHPDVFLKIIVDKVMKYQPDRIAAESQAAQEFFVHKLKEALRSEGYPSHNRVDEIKQRTRKELRIEALLPDIESGALRFSRRHSMLLEQFERYPVDHDDLPDALEMAVSISKKGAKKIINKPLWL